MSSNSICQYTLLSFELLNVLVGYLIGEGVQFDQGELNGKSLVVKTNVEEEEWSWEDNPGTWKGVRMEYLVLYVAVVKDM